MINWKIPGAAGAAVLAAPVAVTAANAPEKLICKRKLRPGTLAIYERKCLRKSDWDRLSEEMKGPWDEMQGKKGHTG